MTLNILLPDNTQPSIIEIYTMDGKKIVTAYTNQLTHQLDIQSLTKGTYMLRVCNNQKTTTTKFVRQ